MVYVSYTSVGLVVCQIPATGFLVVCAYLSEKESPLDDLASHNWFASCVGISWQRVCYYAELALQNNTAVDYTRMTGLPLYHHAIRLQ